MKFGVHLSTNLTPEWNSQYIQYGYMKELLEKAVNAAPIIHDDEDNPARELYFLRADEDFFQYCKKQATKIDTFFAEKLTEASRRFATLSDEVQYRKSMHGEVPTLRKSSVAMSRRTNKVSQCNDNTNVKTGERKRSSIITPLSRILPDRLLKNNNGHEGKPFMNFKNTGNLKVAFSEFYLMLILLQKYQLLNFTGFRKILKKHDKLFQTTRGEEWRKSHIDGAIFWTSTAVSDLIRDVETIYTDTLQSGDRARAMKRLRVPPLEEKQSSVVTFRVGIFIGMICILLPIVLILITVLSKSRSGKSLAWREGLHLYRSTFLIIMQIILGSINVYGWSSAGVNHILIFGIDPRHHLTYQQLLEIGTCLCVFWLLSFITFIVTSYLDFYPFIHPLIFVILMILFVINPIPVFHRPARYWLLKTVGRIFSSAFHQICFAEFWLCNQLASIELAFFDIEYFFCFYISDRNWWSSNLTSPASPKGTFCTGWSRFVLQAFLLAIPSSLRFTQCVRRYYDSKQKFPHLVNAGKYASSFFVAITNSLRRAGNLSYIDNLTKNPFIYTWAITAFISSTYKLTWDLKMDWGLFHKNAGENKFLRDQLVYSSKKYYYYAMIQDIILRYIWMINIFVQFYTPTAEYSDVIGFSFGLVELIRRFSWNFFRLENEHLNNCGQFRAVRDISIAPITTGINFTLINSKLSKEPGIRSRRMKFPYETILEEDQMNTTDDISMDEFENNVDCSNGNRMSTPNNTTVMEVNKINEMLKGITSTRSNSMSSLDDNINSSSTVVLQVDQLNGQIKH